MNEREVVLALVAGLSAVVLAFSCGGGDGGSCAATDYPAYGKAADNILYVSVKCAGAEEDGTLDHPFASIGAALSAAPEGAAILVAPGTYEEEQTLLVSQPIALIGSGRWDEESGEYIDGTVVKSSQANALYVDGALGVTIRGLTLSEPVAAGLVVRDSGNLELAENHVAGVNKTPAGEFGLGIAVSDSENVTLRANFVQDCESVGILVSLSTVSVIENRVNGCVEGIRLSECPPFTGEQNEASKEPVEAGGNVLKGNFSSGLNILSSIVRLTGNTVEDTVAVDGLALGAADGLVAACLEDGATQGRPAVIWFGGDGEAEGNTVTGSARVGVLISDETEVVDFSHNLVEGNLGGGVWIQIESVVQSMTANTITGNTFIGVGLTAGAGANIGGDTPASANLIAQTQALQTMGDGIGVFDDSRATIRSNHVLDNFRAGIIVDNAEGELVQISDNVIDGGEYDIVLQGGADSEVPPDKVVGNTTDVPPACVQPDCDGTQPAQVTENYGDAPKLEVLDSLLSPCIPPDCT